MPEAGLDLVIICVGTPIDETGSTNTSYVARALDLAVPAIASGAACIIRSTLPVGSALRLANRTGVAPARLLVAPEFLRQGSALEDIHRPTRVVIGTFGDQPDPDALVMVTGALASAGSPLLVMRAEEASPVKNASNVFLALRPLLARPGPQDPAPDGAGSDRAHGDVAEPDTMRSKYAWGS